MFGEGGPGLGCYPWVWLHVRVRRTRGSELVAQGFRIQPEDHQIVDIKDIGILYRVPEIRVTMLLLPCNKDLGSNLCLFRWMFGEGGPGLGCHPWAWSHSRTRRTRGSALVSQGSRNSPVILQLDIQDVVILYISCNRWNFAMLLLLLLPRSFTFIFTAYLV